MRCQALATEVADLGRQLWCEGYFFGTDRRDGLSPGAYGDDAIVGLALVCQIAGELGRGCGQLLTTGNRYAMAALLRQLIEVEYLAWWLGEHPERAAEWLRATPDQLDSFFRPGALRQQADGLFRRSEYQAHCQLGGHPHPSARVLLPDHDPGITAQQLYGDLRGVLNGSERLPGRDEAHR